MTDHYVPTQLMLDWEAELRNPDRRQAKGVLCKQDDNGQRSHCCLGVLEEVAGNVAEGETVLADGTKTLAFYGPTADGEVALPNSRLILELLGKGGSVSLMMGVNSEGNRVYASDLNDEYDWTFEEIADQVRKVYIEGSGDAFEYPIPDKPYDFH